MPSVPSKLRKLVDRLPAFGPFGMRYIADPEVQRQLVGDLPIVVEVSAVVVLAVIGQRDVRKVDLARTTDVVDAAGDARNRRREQEVGAAGVAAVDRRDRSVVAVVVEFTARPRWLQG